MSNIASEQMKEQFVKYNDEMMNYLEYIGYPEYSVMLGLSVEGTAEWLHNVAIGAFMLQFSPRKAAVMIFSITLNEMVNRTKGMMVN